AGRQIGAESSVTVGAVIRLYLIELTTLRLPKPTSHHFRENSWGSSAGSNHGPAKGQRIRLSSGPRMNAASPARKSTGSDRRNAPTDQNKNRPPARRHRSARTAPP